MIAALVLMLLFQDSAAPRAPVLVPLGTHPYVVESGSMQPTLQEGAVILADRMQGQCGHTDPTPGDVVIVRRGTEPWVRRVIAGPGQTVQMLDNRLYIDGAEVKQDEVSGGRKTAWGQQTALYRETLPNGRSHLVEDFGPGQDLDDTPLLTVPPGHWFTMGDSRDNAIDSRIDGPTAAADLCGVVIRILQADDPSLIGTKP